MTIESPAVASTPSSASSSGSSAPASSGAASSAGVPTSSTASSDASTGASYDFSSIFSDTESSEPAADVAPAVTATPAGAEPAPVEPVAVAQPAPVAPQVSPPVEQRAAEPAQAPQPAASAQASSLDLNDPQAIAAHLFQNRAAVENVIAQQLFQLSADDVEALQSDAAVAVPKLLARAYVLAQVGFLQQLNRLVPSMLDRHSSTMKAYQANEDKFFSAWPQIDRAKHGDLVYRAATIYRQMNPQASVDDLIDQVGRFVSHQAGLQIAPRGKAPPVAAPAAKPPLGFRPAGSGPSGIASTPQPGSFEYLGGMD